MASRLQVGLRYNGKETRFTNRPVPELWLHHHLDVFIGINYLISIIFSFYNQTNFRDLVKIKVSNLGK